MELFTNGVGTVGMIPAEVHQDRGIDKKVKYRVSREKSPDM
jgi:hypothetical protein